MNICKRCAIWRNAIEDPETAKTAFCVVVQKRVRSVSKACENYREA